MPQFKFNTISRTDIESSLGGAQMIKAIDYDGPNNVLISGCAGSGKTTVSLMRAERLSNQNQTILVLTYQDLLQTSLINTASVGLANKISKFHKWYTQMCRQLVGDKNESAMLTDLAKVQIYDEIIVDEGQNFELRIHRTLMQKCKKYTVGADNAQRVHKFGLPANRIKEEVLKKGNLLSIPLEYNYRNTYEIYNFARHFMPFDERANNILALEKIPKGKGDKPSVFLVPDEDTRVAQLYTLLRDAGDRNSAVLVYGVEEVEAYYNLIRQLNFGCSYHHNVAHVGSNIENILVTTFKSAQGLEFQVVIMPDMETAGNTRYKTDEHYYVGCTRAKENLYLISKGEAIPDCINKFEESSYTVVKVEKKSRPSVPKAGVQVDDDLPF